MWHKSQFVSHEAATECGPRLKPWGLIRERKSPAGAKALFSFALRSALFLVASATAICLLAFWVSPAAAQKTATANLTADLPTGAMQAKATTACLECHEARIILQQRISKAAWTKEVDKMIKWGAVVDPADRDPLIDYLSTNFSPDKPPYEPQRTSGGKFAK